MQLISISLKHYIISILCRSYNENYSDHMFEVSQNYIDNSNYFDVGGQLVQGSRLLRHLGTLLPLIMVLFHLTAASGGYR